MALKCKYVGKTNKLPEYDKNNSAEYWDTIDFLSLFKTEEEKALAINCFDNIREVGGDFLDRNRIGKYEVFIKRADGKEYSLSLDVLAYSLVIRCIKTGRIANPIDAEQCLEDMTAFFKSETARKIEQKALEKYNGKCDEAMQLLRYFAECLWHNRTISQMFPQVNCNEISTPEEYWRFLGFLKDVPEDKEWLAVTSLNNVAIFREKNLDKYHDHLAGMCAYYAVVRCIIFGTVNWPVSGEDFVTMLEEYLDMIRRTYNDDEFITSDTLYSILDDFCRQYIEEWPANIEREKRKFWKQQN